MEKEAGSTLFGTISDGIIIMTGLTLMDMSKGEHREHAISMCDNSV